MLVVGTKNPFFIYTIMTYSYSLKHPSQPPSQSHLPSQLDIDVHAVHLPLSPAQQRPEPLHPEAGPLGALGRDGVGCRAGERPGRRVCHLHHGGVEGRVGGGARPREEPVALEVEEAPVGPVARREEQDEQEDGAVHAGPVEEVGAHEEEEDEGRRGVGRDEEEGEPAATGPLAGEASGVGGDFFVTF